MGVQYSTNTGLQCSGGLGISAPHCSQEAGVSNVRNIYRWRCMSRVLMGGAGGRRNVRLCHMQQRTVQFSDVS